ncbi:MAG: ferredoxin [Verrucomicrobia bacterium RIFCSPLOWO2_12_FULL_64_8]|nr:MAG: ferredoxin [Verrucomicrobia bacterium RIFCSPLOWO2_12_FULL_64_8]
MPDTISFTLNGQPVRLDTDRSRTLLWVLRTDLGLTGTKFGCGEGHCGGCTVLVNQRAARSCIYQLKDVAGQEVVTIEGLAPDGRLHAVQQAFIEHDALQCGFCTPGMILEAVSMLHANPRPSRAEIIRDLEQNFCRCGAHPRIIEAVHAAAEKQGGM